MKWPCFSKTFIVFVQFRQITFTHQSEDGLYVKGEQKLLLRLLSNLLDNAAKNTSAGGHVNLEAFRQGEQVIIKASDTGCGIAPEHIDRVFERFYRISGNRAPGSGFGLGLSFCRSIVKRHGGGIKAESELGKGSTFIATLPLG